MEITLKDLVELVKSETPNVNNNCDAHWEIGKNYLIRTVTMTHVGRLEKITDKEIVLSKAAWIPDTNRFSDALRNYNFGEVEMFLADRNVIIGRGSLIDAQNIDINLDDLKTK